jgi:hypothetical protein
MKLAQLQNNASKTWAVSPGASKAPPTMVQLYLALCLSDTAGRIALYSRKRIREGKTFDGYNESVAKSIGDCLWFLSELATALGKDLDTIASDMLRRAELRWPPASPETTAFIKKTISAFERGFPPEQRLPNELKVEFLQTKERRAGYSCVSVSVNGRQIGDTIDDNILREDSYRFHDALHLAFMVYLGWSPVMRSLLKRKRKSNRQVDRTQDGARAADTEEVVVRRTFIEAEKNGFYAGATIVDTSLLEEIQLMVRGLEVDSLPAIAWQEAILNGYKIHLQLRQNGGVVYASRSRRSLRFMPLSKRREQQLLDRRK